jgi:putative sterol carrier protein
LWKAAVIRQIIVDEIIRRFPDYIDPVAAKGVNGVFRWELVGFGDEIDDFTLMVEDGSVKVGRELHARPTVTLRLGVVSFLKLAAGNGDPSTMALSGDLEIDGDADFALHLLQLLRIPTARGLVQIGGPGKVDVGAIARLVRQVPDRQLRERLRGPVRQILLDEIFRRMPGYLNVHRCAGVDVLVAWQITGRPDGGRDEYRTLVRGGRCVVGGVGELPGRPTVGIRTDPTVFFKLVTSNLNPVAGLLRRRLTVRGNLLVAARLTRIFDIPRG